jgi:hypothetical protein
MTAQEKIIQFIKFLEKRLLSTTQEHNKAKLIARIEQLKNELSQL